MKCFIVVFALVALSHGYSIGGGLYGGQILGQGQVLGVPQGVVLPGVISPLSQSGIVNNVWSQNIPVGLKLSLLQLLQQQQISNQWGGIVGGYQIPIQSSIYGTPVVQSGLTQFPVGQGIGVQGLLGNLGVQGLLGNVGVNQLGLNSLWQNLGQPVVGSISPIWNGGQILGNTVGQQVVPLVY